MFEKTLKLAVIGGGMFFEDIIGQSLIDCQRSGISGALNSIGMSRFAPKVANIGIELVAVGTHSAKSGTAGKICEAIKEEFPSSSIKPHYGNTAWKEIIDEHQPDILFVATPDHIHFEPIMYALAHDVHVITEKPACLTTEEIDKIIQAAKKADRIVSVDMHKRYDPFVRELLTHSLPRYGTINRVRTVLEEPLAVSSEVFAWAEQSNPFTYVGCHWLDVVAHYMNVLPKSLYATGEKNLLVNWDSKVQRIAALQNKPLSEFKKHEKIDTWDSVNVNITYDNGMRGDYNNNWINPDEFEGAVNQEIEVYGTLGRGMVDQQDRGFREAIIGDGSRTRNPAFGGRISNADQNKELFGYGKASIIAGLLAIMRKEVLGESLDDLETSYPTAASQRSVTMILEATADVIERNRQHFKEHGVTPVTASFEDDTITIWDPFLPDGKHILYKRASV